MNGCPLCMCRKDVQDLREQNKFLQLRLKSIYEITRDESDAIEAASVVCDIAAETLAFFLKKADEQPDLDLEAAKEARPWIINAPTSCVTVGGHTRQ